MSALTRTYVCPECGYDGFRMSALEELMRCGSLAVSDRIDGTLGKRRADHIRRIAYETCWPEDAAPGQENTT